MTKNRKLEKLLDAINPWEAETVLHTQDYPFNYVDFKGTGLKNVVKDFYTNIGRKYKHGHTVNPDVVDAMNTVHGDDSFRGAYLLKVRGQEVTVHINNSKFTLACLVEYYKLKYV